MVTEQQIKLARDKFKEISGITIYTPDEGSLDDFEQSRYEGLVAALEAALSAAEPVAWQPRYKQEVIDHHKSIGSDLCEYAMTVYPTKEQAQGYGYGGHECRALYADPPAPSVAVQALQWIVAHPAESNAVVWDVAKNVLSAQVQDVAGWQTTLPTYHRYPYVVENISGKWHLRIHHGNGASHTISTHDSAAEAIAAAPAKQEG